MAGLIPMDELTELKPASEVKVVADSAYSILEEKSVAACINTAANTGEHHVVWQKTLSPEMITKLESKGYRVQRQQHAANPDFYWWIEGF